mmetsp:Transcript_34972/g.91832  ORF Transcript_34972/g.91832 Transcript_34972/m.91832 type:complete len:99 (-) Transcript_34972:147-443(-)
MEYAEMLMGTPNQVLGTTVASEWVRGHRSTCMGYRGENDILVHNAHSGAYSPRGAMKGWDGRRGNQRREARGKASRTISWSCRMACMARPPCTLARIK